MGSAASYWVIPLSKWTLSAVNIDHLSVNNCTLPAIKPQDTVFEHQAGGPLLSSDWLVNSVMEVSHDDWQAVSGSRNCCPVLGVGTTLQRAQPWLLPLSRLNAVIHHYLLTLYVGEEDEMSSRSKTWAKHHWYIKIQIFLSLLTWQKPVKFVNSKLYSACLYYVQIIWGEVAWF